MKLPHVLDSQYLKDRKGHEWLVVGKGPSFNLDLLSTWRNSGNPIMSINGAGMSGGTRMDAVICNDRPALIDVMEDFFLMYLVICANGAHEGTPPEQRTLSQAIRLGRAMRGHEGVLHVFDTRTNDIREFPEHPVIDTWISTAESAFDILGHIGVKHISTIGVACGGNDYHPHFGSRDHALGDFSPLPALLNKLCVKHGITWTKL